MDGFLKNWTAKRAGGRITVYGVDAANGGPLKVVGIDTIAPGPTLSEDAGGRPVIGIIATRFDGTKYELLTK